MERDSLWYRVLVMRYGEEGRHTVRKGKEWVKFVEGDGEDL